MNNVYKLGGVALIAGAVLNITRVPPIMLSEGVSRANFPPHGLVDTVYVTSLYSWHISHIMAIISVPLLLLGLLVLSGVLADKGQRNAGLAALFGIGSGAALYFFAAVIDGIVLPSHIRNMTDLIDTNPELAEALIDRTHLFATAFGGIAAPMMLISAVFLGKGQLLGFKNKLLGYFGIALGIVGLAGYVTGFLPLNISDAITRVGPLMLLFFVYLIIHGVALMRLPKGISK